MKLAGRLLTLILSLQLILPADVGFLLPSTALAQESCGTGMEWHSQLNRCVTKKEVIQTNNERDTCMAMTDAAARQECLANAANNAATTAGYEASSTDAIKGFGNVSLSIAVLMSVITVYAVLKKKAMTPQCKAPSFLMLAGGSLAITVGEIGSYIKFRSGLKDAKKEYDKVAEHVNPEDDDGTKTQRRAKATDAQIQAFNAMIKKEEATRDAGNWKKGGYWGGVALYGAAALVAIYEQIMISTPYTAATANQQYVISCQGIKAKADITVPKNDFYANYYKSNESLNQLLRDVKPVKLDGSNPINFVMSLSESHSWTSGDLLSPSIDEYKLISSAINDSGANNELVRSDLNYVATIINNVILPSAHAEEESMGKGFEMNTGDPISFWIQSILGLGAGITLVSIGSISSGIMNLLGKPVTRLIAGGLFAGYSGAMVAHITSEVDKVQGKIDILTKLRDSIEGYSDANECRPEDRGDMGKPVCFCYTDSGDKNPARAESATCKSFWGKNPNFNPKKYAKGGGGTGPVGCLDKAGKFDQGCSCKKTNTCSKLQNGFSMGGLNGATAFGPLAGTYNSMMEGNMDSAQLANNFAGQAKAIRAATDKVLKNPKNKKLAAQVAKNQAALRKQFEAQAAALNYNPGSGSGQSLAGLSPVEAIKELKKDLDKDIKQQQAASGVAATGGSGEEDMFGDLGLGGGGAGVVVDEGLGDVMAQDFKYGSNDISSDKNANIFDLLSLRYQRSALRRLFGGETEMEADAAEKSDINNQ